MTLLLFLNTNAACLPSAGNLAAPVLLVYCTVIVAFDALRLPAFLLKVTYSTYQLLSTYQLFISLLIIKTSSQEWVIVTFVAHLFGSEMIMILLTSLC